MYQGIIRQQGVNNTQFRMKYQMLQSEETIINNAVQRQLVIKTKDFCEDTITTYRDFDILNLQAIGATGQLKECALSPSMDTIERQATSANKVLEQVKQQNNE